MHVSPNDTNQYRYKMLPNGLRALLIHDSSAKKSAAALAVNVGHFDDPLDREGLAHYLEHMLFLGTEKYPTVGEFQQFISQHGGSNNAWTGTEHTCYFFDIAPPLFESALDRFSQFFSAPLFNEEALDKERQAVESEYKLKLSDDARRLYQVQKEVANPLHPFAKFSVGNLETLNDRDGQSIRNEIVEFHQNHYSADLMTLTILSSHPLDECEAWLEEKFSTITNNQLNQKQVAIPFVAQDHRSIWVNVEPVKDLRKLTLSFSLPGMDKQYDTKPLSYFAHLLGYEGEGSLLMYLKQAGWITSLSAGGGVSGSNFREFNISCGLTPLGINNTEQIVQVVFEYIHLIGSQGFAEWRYLEKKAVLESAFRFQESSRPMDIASHLVMNMQNYAAEDVIYGDYKMSHYDEDELRGIYAYLNVNNVKITQVTKGLPCDQTAKWYYTPYSIQPLTEQQKSDWNSAEPRSELALPPENPFICYDLDPNELESSAKQPQLVEELPGFRLWHLQEQEYRVPKGMLFVAIDSPQAVSTSRKIVKTRLCVEMFLDSLSSKTYQAEIAGMNYNLYAHQGGVTLTLSGFSEKLPQLLNIILAQFTERDFNPERFELIKQQLLRSWKNAAEDRPISQLFNTMTGILQPNNPSYAVLLEALETIQVDELPAFVESMLSEIHLETFVYGDWPKSQAFEIAETLKDTFRVENQRYEESLRPLVMLGKNGSFQRSVYCNQEDSAIVVYYQSEQVSANDTALYLLTNHLMSAGFFHEIRTKQQLGYMVGTGNMPLNRHPGLVLYVQSPNAAPIDLIASIDEFLNAFYMVLLELNEEQWQSSKLGLLNQISTPDTTLRNRGQRFWVAIGNKDTQFNHRELVIDEIQALSRVEMIRFVVNELKPRTANRFIMHTQGNAHQDAPALSVGSEIGSIEEFQLLPKDYDIG